jgi:hypothetical protein
VDLLRPTCVAACPSVNFIGLLIGAFWLSQPVAIRNAKMLQAIGCSNQNAPISNLHAVAKKRIILPNR